MNRVIDNKPPAVSIHTPPRPFFAPSTSKFRQEKAEMQKKSKHAKKKQKCKKSKNAKKKHFIELEKTNVFQSYSLKNCKKDSMIFQMFQVFYVFLKKSTK